MHSLCVRCINICNLGVGRGSTVKIGTHISIHINLFVIFVDWVTPQIELKIDYCGSLDIALHVGLSSTPLLLTLQCRLIIIYLHIVTFMKKMPH